MVCSSRSIALGLEFCPDPLPPVTLEIIDAPIAANVSALLDADDDAPPEPAPPAALAPDVVPAAVLATPPLADAIDASGACEAPMGVREDA
ncbi:hypothetical protein Bpla01_39210 [Burkholderia plantarii]|nr:hypothetical protein Bpla01_39210 [Burkholderia plantarii]